MDEVNLVGCNFQHFPLASPFFFFTPQSPMSNLSLRHFFFLLCIYKKRVPYFFFYFIFFRLASLSLPRGHIELSTPEGRDALMNHVITSRRLYIFISFLKNYISNRKTKKNIKLYFVILIIVSVVKKYSIFELITQI